MKNDYIIATIAGFLTLFLMFLLAECTQPSQKEKTSNEINESVFVIIAAKEDQFPNFTLYHASMPDETHLGSADFWFRAKSGKYKIGDPLVLTLKIIKEPDTSQEPDTLSQTTINKIAK